MTFDPNVIDDLGAKLYSTLPPVIAELIANGYDACAKNVFIDFDDADGEKTITITDDGIGMSFKDINEKYLCIGKKRRAKGEAVPLSCKRLPIGKKGLGKLAFFGIANRADIRSVVGGKYIQFEMNWKKIQKEKKVYSPAYSSGTTTEEDGTKIILSGLYRKTDIEIHDFAKSISNYFILDKNFQVHIRDHKGGTVEVTNELRYQFPDREIEFSWDLPSKKFEALYSKHPFARKLKGQIILFEKPVHGGLRGVTLFSRKKLVNLPEFFPVQGSSYFFQYLTGWIEIDYVDNLVPDVISTNRSSLNWNDPRLADLIAFLKKAIGIVHTEWKQRKQKKTNKSLKTRFNIDPKTWRASNASNKVIRNNIDRFIGLVKEPDEIEESNLLELAAIIHELAPEHADFVLWKGLNPFITNNEIIKKEYLSQNYYEAAKEAVQRYNEIVSDISCTVSAACSRLDGYQLMEASFGKEQAKIIWLTDKKDQNDDNIENGQKLLSQGVIIGFKNPAVSHTSRTSAKTKPTFSDKNCLDILCLISYLMDRVTARKKPPVGQHGNEERIA